MERGSFPFYSPICRGICIEICKIHADDFCQKRICHFLIIGSHRCGNGWHVGVCVISRLTDLECGRCKNVRAAAYIIGIAVLATNGNRVVRGLHPVGRNAHFRQRYIGQGFFHSRQCLGDLVVFIPFHQFITERQQEQNQQHKYNGLQRKDVQVSFAVTEGFSLRKISVNFPKLQHKPKNQNSKGQQRYQSKSRKTWTLQ